MGAVGGLLEAGPILAVLAALDHFGHCGLVFRRAGLILAALIFLINFGRFGLISAVWAGFGLLG